MSPELDLVKLGNAFIGSESLVICIYYIIPTTLYNKFQGAIMHIICNFTF